MQASILEPNDIHKHLKVKPEVWQKVQIEDIHLRSGRKPLHFKERKKSGGKSEAHRKRGMEDEGMICRKGENQVCWVLNCKRTMLLFVLKQGSRI